MGSVRRRGERIVASLQDEEVRVLRLLVGDLQTLLTDPGAPAEQSDDPLARLVNLPTGQPERPDDPALARLFPDGYSDPAAAAELRRLTEADLRATKHSAAAALLESLPESGGRFDLSTTAAAAWAGALNDLRLVLGTRLEVTEDSEPFGGLGPDDPAAAPYAIYHWLTGLQDDLVLALMP